MGNLLTRVRVLVAARKTPSPSSAPTYRSSSQRQSSFLKMKRSTSISTKSRKTDKNKYAYIPDNYSSLEQVPSP